MRPYLLRTLLVLMLALAFGAGGSSGAFAHGDHTGLTAMVICGENGATTVYLDATGKPVDPDRACLSDPCDACMPSAPTTMAALATWPVAPGTARALSPRPDRSQPEARRVSPASARGPPAGANPA